MLTTRTDSESYEKQYTRLNAEQKKAVDAIEGTVMVIAGPGTGKTSILTLRIATILRQTDTAAPNILALTFTESGVFSMRRKLVDIIDGEAYKVAIYTFHGFCNDIIKRYPEEFPRIISSMPASDIDQIRIIELAVDETKLERLKPYGDPYYYVRPVLGKIQELKRENISIKMLEEIIAKQKIEYKQIDDLIYESGAHKGKIKGKYKDIEKGIEKNAELLLMYEKYEEALRREKLYDFEDMILEVVHALEQNEDLLLRLQEEYQYILADEHQDANNAQNKLLELLSNFHPNPNLFIVGDEKQAIYRFQGASLDNFLYFKNLYPEATVIALAENYRSTQPILDAAHSLIINNKVADESLRRELKSQQDENSVGIKTPHILFYEFNSPQDEIFFLIDSIQEKIQKGIAPSDIAVLYRNNKDAQAIVAEFRKTDIPFFILSDQDILSRDDIQKIILVLRAVADLSNTRILSEALFVDFLKLSPLDVYKVIRTAQDTRRPLYELLQNEEAFGNVYQKLMRWATLSHNYNLVEFFEIFIEEAEVVNEILMAPGSVDRLQTLNAFFDEVKKVMENHKEYKLEDFLNYIDILKNYKIRINKSSSDQSAEAVSLMTAHKSKGLEFAYVYILNANESKWGNRRHPNHFKISDGAKIKDLFDENQIADERRLFYVALTRAKKEVHITSSRSTADGRPEAQTQFIAEIDLDKIEKIDTSEHEKQFADKKMNQFKTGTHLGANINDKAYLRELFMQQGLSVTALNNYLRCPWDYFFKNLIRIPVVQEKSAMYGTAVHATLKEFFDKYRMEEDLSREEMIALFEGNLRNMPLSQSDFEETLAKGTNALGGYYDTYADSWPRNTITEFNIKGILLEVGSEKILLRGNLDKIEMINGSNVRVVDYKTRKPMTRNDIEGKTKTSTGDYKRQLTFYKLLLDRYDDQRYKMRSGMIDFIEPIEAGQYKSEEFEISDDEVRTLEEEIRRVSKEIMNLEFWNERCEDRECEYCGLRKLINDK